MNIESIKAAVEDAKIRTKDENKRCPVCGDYPQNKAPISAMSEIDIAKIRYCSHCSERDAADALLALWAEYEKLRGQKGLEWIDAGEAAQQPDIAGKTLAIKTTVKKLDIDDKFPLIAADAAWISRPIHRDAKVAVLD